MMKKLINFVLPGVSETIASSRFSARRLISEDLPTLERPMKANSGRFQLGHDFRSGLLTSNTADLIFMGASGLEGRAKRTLSANFPPVTTAFFSCPPRRIGC